MSELVKTFLLAAVSGLLFGLGCLVRPLRRVGSVLCLLWLGAALPVMFFLGLSNEYVLLFYILSAVLGLLFLYGGKP